MACDTDFIKRATGADDLTELDKESIIKFLCQAYALYKTADPKAVISFADFVDMLTEGIHEALTERTNKRRPR